MVAALAISVAMAPASATVGYAPLGDTAVFNFGGDGASTDNTLVAGGVTPSVLTFNNSDPVSFGNKELEAVFGKTPSLLGNVTLETGAGNNGVWFTVDYQRFVGMIAPNAPAGMQMGTLQFSITSTLIASVTTTGPLQDFTFAGDLEVTDLNGFYNSPTSGTFRLTGNTATSFPAVGFSLQIELAGADPIVTQASEPAMLAVMGGGLLVIGIAQTRRRRA